MEEKRNIIVLINHIHCQQSTSEGFDDEVYVVVRTSAGDKFTYFFDNPLIMRGEKHGADSTDANVDISINASYLDWITVELRERDSDTDTVSLGDFKLTRDSEIEDTVRIYQPSGDKEGIYDVSYRVIDKPIPTLRILGLKCEQDSAGCNTDFVETIMTVSEEIASECADVLAKSPRPSRKLMAKGFDKASEIIGHCTELVLWIADALEGPDDIYMQHTDPDHPNTEGGPVFPENDKNYKMESGDTIYFEHEYENHYYRIPLDKGDVTVQLREDDPNKKDISVGSITIRQADYDRLKTQGAQIELAGDYFSEKENGQGAIYYICYSVGIEDWSKPATAEAQSGVGTVDEPPEEGIYYNLVNWNSKRAMIMHKEKDQPGQKVCQGYDDDFSNSRWRVEYAENGYMQLINDYSGNCIGLVDGDKGDGDNIVLLEPGDSPRKFWKLEVGGQKDGEGYYYLLNKDTEKALSVKDASKELNAELVQFGQRDMDWNAQKWKFVRTATPYPPENFPDEGVYYKLVNWKSGRAVYVDKEDGAGGNITQSYNEEYSNSRWRVEYFDDYIQIINDYSDRCIGVEEGDTKNGDNLHQLGVGEHSRKLWRLEPGGEFEGKDHFYIVNKSTGKAMSVEDASNKVDAEIIQYNKKGMDWNAQKWRFVKTSTPYTPE